MDSGLEFVELGTNDTNVVGISATGKLTADDITKLVDRLESIQASGSKARVYIDLTGYEGYELSLVKEKFAHLSTFWKSIECCAYVVDKAWMSTAIGSLTLLHQCISVRLAAIRIQKLVHGYYLSQTQARNVVIFSYSEYQ